MDKLYEELLCDAEKWIATLSGKGAMEQYGVDLNNLDAGDALPLAYAKETFRFIRAVVKGAENGQVEE